MVQLFCLYRGPDLDRWYRTVNTGVSAVVVDVLLDSVSQQNRYNGRGRSPPPFEFRPGTGGGGDTEKRFWASVSCNSWRGRGVKSSHGRRPVGNVRLRSGSRALDNPRPPTDEPEQSLSWTSPRLLRLTVVDSPQCSSTPFIRIATRPSCLQVDSVLIGLLLLLLLLY